MTKVTKVSENRVDLELSGSLDGDGMRALLDDLITQSEGVENGVMLYTITDFAMPSASAFGVEFARIPKLFGMISKFDRCAVISDQGWIRSVAELEGALIPGLKIKSFEPEDKGEAEAWLAGE